MDSNLTIPQIDLPRDMIHLGIGQPSMYLLPINKMEKAAAHCLSKKSRSFLAYGDERGNPNFRQTLSGFLSDQYPKPVNPDQLLITNGNSQALDFICNLFTNPGDTILVEEPTYFLALRIFADRGLNLVSIPVDDKGLVTDVLKKKLESLKPSFLYTIPAHHNPACVTMSSIRRKELVEICTQNKLLLVADEVYHFLNYSDDSLPPMGNWIDKCPLISLGSFSKILAPGLRLGWMHTNNDLIQKMVKSGLLDSGGGFNPFTSEIVNSVIRLGLLNTHIQGLKTVYSQRLKIFCHHLKNHLPKKAQFKVPKGGYFIWVKLPENIDTKPLRKLAQKQKVDFNPGPLFSHKKGLKNYLRLSFALYDEKELAKGAMRLGKVISDYLS